MKNRGTTHNKELR